MSLKNLKRFLLGNGSLNDFGNANKVYFGDHPGYSYGNDLIRRAPVLLHADEGRCVKKEQILVVNC